MNPTELAAILALAEQGLKDAAQLYKFFVAKVDGAKTLEQVLSDADTEYQAVIDAAKQELTPVPPPNPTTPTT